MTRSRLAHAAAVTAPPILLLLLACTVAEAWLRYERFGVAGIVDPFAYMPPSYRPVNCIAAGPNGELMTPNCHMHYKGVDLVTNSRGLNDREVDEAAPHYRIAALGDSVSMAAEVQPREAYHALLEDRLNQELGTPGFVEFYNFGRGGRHTAAQVGDLEDALAFGPLDAVLVGAVPSDYIENAVRPEICLASDRSILATEDEREFYEKYVVGINRVSQLFAGVESKTGLWLLERLKDHGRLLARRLRMRPEHVAIMETIEGKAHARFRSCAIRLREIADAAGIDLGWALVWYQPHPHADEMLAILAELDESVESLLDVHEQFDEIESMYIFPHDNHPNAAVQRIFADRIYEHLEAIGWLEKIRAAHAERVGATANP